MEGNQEHVDALKDIRQMMKQSNRFLSLSGFSGILAGIYALAGAYFAHNVIDRYLEDQFSGAPQMTYKNLLSQCAVISFLVLGFSLITAVIFSKRKAQKFGYRLFDHTTWRLFVNMLIPLATGGIFCAALIVNGFPMLGLVSPAMLIFYGLALVNGSKYTLHDIRYLGYMEIALGLIACFYMEFGLLLWTVGFGLLHIIYGAFMWFKYEKGNV